MQNMCDMCTKTTYVDPFLTTRFIPDTCKVRHLSKSEHDQERKTLSLQNMCAHVMFTSNIHNYFQRRYVFIPLYLFIMGGKVINMFKVYCKTWLINYMPVNL